METEKGTLRLPYRSKDDTVFDLLSEYLVATRNKQEKNYLICFENKQISLDRKIRFYINKSPKGAVVFKIIPEND